jgi:hypothetical protein
MRLGEHSGGLPLRRAVCCQSDSVDLRRPARLR